jgi:hypothetical protein
VPSLLIAVALGVVVGCIDISPMLLRKAPPAQIATAFSHWCVLGVLLYYADMPLPGWGKGIAVSLLTSIPLLIGLGATHPSSLLPVLAMTVVLGAALGYSVAKFAVP